MFGNLTWASAGDCHALDPLHAGDQSLQCNLLQAHEYASRAIHLEPDSQQALLALIYVELCKGNCNQALNLLKQQHLSVK